ncbi:hypothetical protein TrRE_jg1407 [Triparma retinervis]|uniref:Uncharacterized protein n=1 Tax=Triparma retinervis TaxID=2557542 RepID=A0A9W7ECV0_9STRA|nr:hypothetical protein TrRE_jg1407 [Triparma retinervis]
MTSQLLAREGTKLQKPYQKLDQVTEEEFESGSWKWNRKYQLWGVRYTTVYKKGELGHRIYVNRDVNAAINIADIYCTLAVTGKRPARHSPSKSDVVGKEVVETKSTSTKSKKKVKPKAKTKTKTKAKTKVKPKPKTKPKTKKTITERRKSPRGL